MKGLTKWDKLECLAEALRLEVPPGQVVTVPEGRKILAKCLEIVARQSYYNNLEILADVLDVVEVIEDEGFFVKGQGRKEKLADPFSHDDQDDDDQVVKADPGPRESQPDTAPLARPLASA